jgi:hypothetical protein
LSYLPPLVGSMTVVPITDTTDRSPLPILKDR